MEAQWQQAQFVHPAGTWGGLCDADTQIQFLDSLGGKMKTVSEIRKGLSWAENEKPSL